jgi:hypothetical protein
MSVRLGRSIVTIVQPAQSLLGKDLTRSYSTNPAVRCLCLPKIPFSGFHQCSIVTLHSKLATISIRQGQEKILLLLVPSVPE